MQLRVERAEELSAPPVLAGALATHTGASAPADAGPSTQNIFNFFYPGVSAPTGKAADDLASEMLWAAIEGSKAMNYVPSPAAMPPGAAWLASQAVQTAFRALTNKNGVYNLVRIQVAANFKPKFDVVKSDAYVRSGGGGGIIVGGYGLRPGGGGILGAGYDQPLCCVTIGPMTIVGYPDAGGGGNFGGGAGGGGGTLRLAEDDPS
jgi:hypothetical protein